MSEQAAIDAAQAVLDAHFRALNAGDETALEATLHFPHFRLAGGRMQIWEAPGHYLRDFHARAGHEWRRSRLTRREVVAASTEKVHIDVAFTRHRDDDSRIGEYRSLWVIARVDGRWAAQLRSSFAA